MPENQYRDWGRFAARARIWLRRHHPRTKSTDIDERISDWMLRRTSNMGKNAGVYTTYQMRAQDQRRSTSLEQYDSDTVGARNPVGDLAEVRWEELKAGALYLGCSASDLFYLHLKRHGLSYPEIERVARFTPHQACDDTIKRRLERLCTRIADAYPYHGLYEMLAEMFNLSVTQAKEFCKRRAE